MSVLISLLTKSLLPNPEADLSLRLLFLNVLSKKLQVMQIYYLLLTLNLIFFQNKMGLIV